MNRRIPWSLLVLVAACVGLLAVPTSAAAAGTRARALPAPGVVWVQGIGISATTIRWLPVRGASVYDVYRAGRRVATTRRTTFTERGLRAAGWHAYQVRARAGARVSSRSDLLPVVTLAPSRCTRWVSPRGNDSGPGTSTRPWRTVRRLVDHWQPGWVGCLSGSFVEDVSIRRGGTARQRVVLRAAPGSRAAIRGRLWISRGADHVVVQDLDLDGRANRGSGADDLPSPTVNGSHVMFIRNDVHNARSRVCFVIGSIRGWGRARGTILASNRIHDCGERNGGNTHHGVYVEGADLTRIVHNVIFQNADRGIQLYPDARGSTITRNVIDGNGEGIIFSGAEGLASSGNRVVRNVITNSRLRYDVEYWWEDPARPGAGNVVARNCVGGGAQGSFALPAVGYVPRGNVFGLPAYRNRTAGDLRLVAGRGACRGWMLSRTLPLAGF